MKVNLRMYLSDFINESYEKDIISKLEDIHKDGIKYYLTLWYRDGTVLPEDINKFLVKYENNLHFKTKIVVDNNLKPNDFIWFDITRREDVNHKQKIRFQYIYDNKNQIFEGLNQFQKTANFCFSDKPTKRQKRNDYED
tara:strand:+ start:264 stop:680 length:417 start_codon:yes stop_codon:yes gene_type:complete